VVCTNPLCLDRKPVHRIQRIMEKIMNATPDSAEQQVIKSQQSVAIAFFTPTAIYRAETGIKHNRLEHLLIVI
jgi:hypothetical protein